MHSHDAAENKASARESYRQQTTPPIRADGGRNLPSDRDFELTLEYTTMDGRRRRVTYVPDADDDARRISRERRDGEWRETSRQLISKLAVQLETDPGQSGDYYPGP